jgi:NAD(P)H dehydrogenase (quinone)
MKCVFDSFSDLTAGKDVCADQVFDNFTSITGRSPATLADFAQKHQENFRYGKHVNT